MRSRGDGGSRALGRTALVLFGTGLALLISEGLFRWHEERTTLGFLGTDQWLVADADLGYRLNPAAKNANSFGIRHPEIPAGKPDDLFRMILLGDSVSWDLGGFVSIIRNRFDQLRTGPAEVVNAAIPGYTTYQERVLLQRDLLSLRPDLVVLQYCVNDNHRFLHQLDASGNWMITPEARREYLGQDALGWLSRRSKLFYHLRLKWAGLGTATGVDEADSSRDFPWNRAEATAAAWIDHTWVDFEEHLRSMKDSLDAIGSRLAVVGFPMSPQLHTYLLREFREETLKPQAHLARICERVGVPFLDLHPAFVKGGTSCFRDFLHLTKQGHDLAAGEILEFLATQGLVTGD